MEKNDSNTSKLEEIRKTVSLENFKPNRFIDTWMDIFSGDTTIRREKFVNIGGEIKTVKDSVLEGVKVTPVENLTFLTWKEVGGQHDKYLAIESKGYFIGVQTHEDYTKSLILVHSTRDEKTGKERQTTRRFTPINK